MTTAIRAISSAKKILRFLRWEPAEFPYDKLGRAPQFSQANFNVETISTVYPKATV
jgi:hypothetical protein